MHRHLICLLLGIGFLLTGAPADDELGRFLAASRAEHNRRVTWKIERSYTFDDDRDLAGFKVLDGQWRVENGQLVAAAGKPDRNRTVLIAPCTWDYVRVEFDATPVSRGDGRIGDICVRFADPETGSFAKHYAAITGQYWNQAGVVYRRNIPIARTEWSPLVDGHTHHVMLEFTLDHLRYWVDGKVVIEAWDRQQPIDVKGTWIGIGTYDTTLRIDNLTIASGELQQRKR